MNELQKTALKLTILVLLGSLLGFNPINTSVTQNARNVQAALAAEDYREGANYLLEIVKIHPWWIDLWETAGEAAFLTEDYQLAVSAFERSRELGQLSQINQVHLGTAYLELGELDSAEDTWRALPDNNAALQNLAVFYEDQGDFSRAIEVWNDYLASSADSTHPDQVFYFGLLIAADTPPKALPYLDQTRVDFPEAERVASAIREAVDQEPAYQLVTTGQALASIGYWRLAAHAFEKAVLLRQDYQEAWIYWGEALQHITNPPADPLETLETGLKLDQDSPLANLFLGLYWQRMGSHDTALEYFRFVESSWPEKADVLVEQGKSLGALGDLEAARGKYQAAVDLEPENDQYYRQLAEFTMTYSYQVKEIGLPAARLAVQLDPLNPANLDTLGGVLLDLEDEMNALKLFQEALELEPSFAPAYFHLGILYSARGREEQAVYYLTQAVLYSDNLALIDQAERLLSTY